MSLPVTRIHAGIVEGKTLVLDATFIKAWSRRDLAYEAEELTGSPHFKHVFAHG